MKILKFIYDIYWKNLGWRLNQFSLSVKNLIKWFPIIWKDRNWDNSFIYDLLEFKLTNMAKYFKERNFFVGQLREAEKMELCVRLIKKLNTEFYSSEYVDIIENKWGRQEMKIDPSTNYLTFEFVDKNYTQDQLAEIMKETRELMTIGRNKEEKAKKILFTLMERNINKWWD